jgi:hypothetical protein
MWRRSCAFARAGKVYCRLSAHNRLKSPRRGRDSNPPMTVLQTVRREFQGVPGRFRELPRGVTFGCGVPGSSREYHAKRHYTHSRRCMPRCARSWVGNGRARSRRRSTRSLRIAASCSAKIHVSSSASISSAAAATCAWSQLGSTQVGRNQRPLCYEDPPSMARPRHGPRPIQSRHVIRSRGALASKARSKGWEFPTISDRDLESAQSEPGRAR